MSVLRALLPAADTMAAVDRRPLTWEVDVATAAIWAEVGPAAVEPSWVARLAAVVMMLEVTVAFARLTCEEAE